jgi:glucosyl-3-phosphoglycerate phosphatase
MDLLLIRHGQSAGNVAGLLNSTEQDGLTDHGLQQASNLRSTMEELGLKADRVYSSPWKRALQTTEVLFHDKCSWTLDPRLGETNPGRFATWKATEFREEEFLPIADTTGLLVAVCHAGPISVISQYLLSIPLSLFPNILVPNASLTLFRRNEHSQGFHLQIAGLS